MRLSILLLAIIFCLPLTGCDEEKTVQSIRTGAAGVQAAATALYTSLHAAYATGQITEAQWTNYCGIYARYTTANQTLMDCLKVWQLGAKKPTMERLQVLFENLNVIIADMNKLIGAWKVKTVALPHLEIVG